MGYYNELLKEAEKLKDKLTDIVIAREVAAVFGKDHKEFEDICLFVREMYFNVDSYDVNAMCRAIINFGEDHEYKTYKGMFKHNDPETVWEAWTDTEYY